MKCCIHTLLKHWSKPSIKGKDYLMLMRVAIARQNPITSVVNTYTCCCLYAVWCLNVFRSEFLYCLELQLWFCFSLKFTH